jgi:hypothetical protein
MLNVSSSRRRAAVRAVPVLQRVRQDMLNMDLQEALLDTKVSSGSGEAVRSFGLLDALKMWLTPPDGQSLPPMRAELYRCLDQLPGERRRACRSCIVAAWLSSLQSSSPPSLSPSLVVGCWLFADALCSRCCGELASAECAVVLLGFIRTVAVSVSVWSPVRVDHLRESRIGETLLKLSKHRDEVCRRWSS